MKLIRALIISLLPFLVLASNQTDACKAMENIRLEMNVISSNIVNVSTTRIPNGGPYLVKEFVCVDLNCEIKETSKILTKYEPSHLDADKNGYVSYPDIDLMQQMNSMILATRKYEEAAKSCH